MKTLTEIAAGISDGSLLHASAFADVDFDALLDQRDSSEFEEDWLKASDEVATRWNDFAAASSIEAEVDKIRELAFKKCYEYTEESEISGYVSDDFELLAKASAMHLDSAYLEKMATTYAKGGVPG